MRLSVVGPLHDGMWVIHNERNERWNGREFSATDKPKRYRSYAAGRKDAGVIAVVKEYSDVLKKLAE